MVHGAVTAWAGGFLRQTKINYMSRMKLFSIFSAMMGAMLADPKKSPRQKNAEVKSLNKQSGGMLFMGNPYGPKPLNQRQKRKRWRQSPHLRKKAA